MQRRDCPVGHRSEQREMKLVDMEVQDVEIVGAFAHAVKHQHVVGDRIADVGIEPQRRGNAGDELARR